MIYVFALILSLIDQVVRNVALSHLSSDGTIKITPQLYVCRVFNNGGALGVLFSDQLLLISLSTLMGICLIYLLQRPNFRTLQKLSLATALGGTASNLFERVMYRTVVDYLYSPTLHIYFNIADVLFVVGLLVFGVTILMSKPAP